MFEGFQLKPGWRKYHLIWYLKGTALNRIPVLTLKNRPRSFLLVFVRPVEGRKRRTDLNYRRTKGGRSNIK